MFNVYYEANIRSEVTSGVNSALFFLSLQSAVELRCNNTGICGFDGSDVAFKQRNV